MNTPHPSLLHELAVVLAGAFATGIVAAGITFLWNVQLKRREFDLITAKAFHELYGEFFSIWKLWNYYVRDIGPASFPDASRWEILERACSAEGRLEATFIELTSNRKISRSSIEDLGQFRQVYQQLRESIRDNKPIDWDWSEHDAYTAFKRLAPSIALMIRTGRQTRSKRAKMRAGTWLDVTSNRFEDFWLERPHDYVPRSGIVRAPVGYRYPDCTFNAII